MPESEKAGLFRPYRVFETQQFLRDLAGLGASTEEQLKTKLREHIYPILEREPHRGPNIKRLKGWEPSTWRYRVGQWRLFYTVDEGERIVLMASAGHRREVYH